MKGGGKWGRRGREVGEKGEGSWGKGGGNWEWGTPCPPPILAVIVFEISNFLCPNLQRAITKNKK